MSEITAPVAFAALAIAFALFLWRQSITFNDRHSREIAIKDLIVQVRFLAQRSKNPQQKVNAEEWVSGWIRKPCPALSGGTPYDEMCTVRGQQLVFGIVEKFEI